MERELQEEVVLDLPGLLALCLRKGIWILLVTVLCGLALPSFKLYKALQSQKAESQTESTEESAEKKAKEKEQSLEYAGNERKRLEALLSSERESLANSALMKIDPTSYGERDINLYLPLEEGGQTLSNQEIAARLSAVSQAYSDALQSGTFYSDIAKRLGGKVAEKDLSDLIYVEGNDKSAIVSIYLVGSSEKLAKEMGDAVLSYVEEKKAELDENLPAYKLEILSDNVYTAKNSGSYSPDSNQSQDVQNFPLLQRQQQKIDRVEKLSTQLTDWKKKEKEAKGDEVLGTQGISKKTLVKYAILGIFLGGFLSVAVITVPYLFAKELPREEDLEMSYGLMVLGSKKRYKKQGFFKKWSEKLAGENERCETEEELFRLSKANLTLLAKEKGIQEELLFIGAKGEMGKKLVQYVGEENPLSASATEDILQSPEGIQALSDHKYLVLAYPAQSDFLNFLKTKKKCEALGKEVLGVILY